MAHRPEPLLRHLGPGPFGQSLRGGLAPQQSRCSWRGSYPPPPPARGSHPARPVGFRSAVHPLTSPDTRRPPRRRKPFDAIPPAESGLQEGSKDRPLRHNEARRARRVRAPARRPLRTMFSRCLLTPRATQTLCHYHSSFLSWHMSSGWARNRRDTHPHVCMDYENSTRRRRDSGTPPPLTWCLLMPQQLCSLSTQP